VISSDSISSSTDDIDLGAIWAVLWDYRLLVALVTTACTIAAVVVALMTAPVYRAEVVITEVRDNMNSSGSIVGQLGGLASLAGVNLAANSPGRESRAFLQSRSLVEQFIKRYQLLPELYQDAKKPPTLWRGVQKFRTGILSVREDTRKGITTISIEWRDPNTAARWANDLVALVNELLRTRAMDEAKRNVDYLQKQVAGTNVVELQRVMYNLIENETKTLMLANVRVEYAFEVVDPAVAPEVRIKPKRTLMVAFGAALGFLIGAVTAFLHNSARRKRRASPVGAAS
jgi:uncharacterized protein involved in exopolysaccharide biosynthesis